MTRTALPRRRGVVFLGAASLGAAALCGPSASAEEPGARRWSDAVFAELSTGFVPVANDVPWMAGIGVRAAGIHEVWARLGYMPVGDDVGWGFGVVGYRAVFRPGRVVRPIAGGYFAGLPATCGHDEKGRPACTRDNLFIWSASGGVRFEPVPWLGVAATLALGVDSYPNPFGMVELATTFALPVGR